MPGLIVAKHIFEGLERPLYNDGDENGDVNKRIYVWRPRYDYIFNRGKMAEMRVLAPENKVFVVIVTPNTRPKHAANYPDIKAWIDRWGWVEMDQGPDEMPIDWVDRFNIRLMTRE